MSNDNEVKRLEELFLEDIHYFEKNGVNMSMRRSCHDLDDVLDDLKYLEKFNRVIGTLQRIRSMIPRYMNYINELDSKIIQLTAKIDARKNETV